MYTNEDLQIFVDLSQTLSFSQTARNLHLSQSTVSKRIKDLETALQVILIERGQGMKSLRLTLAGGEIFSLSPMKCCLCGRMPVIWEGGAGSRLLRLPL